jgi:hypothetical protein
LVACVLFLAGRLLYVSAVRVKNSQAISASISSLPHIKLKEAGSDRLFDTDSVKRSNIVIVYFSADCEHCEYEAREIASNLSRFDSTEWLFISEFTDSAILGFARRVNLSGIDHVHFLKVEFDFIFQTFGTTVYPSLFLYNRNRKLIQSFKGETSIDHLTNALKTHAPAK